MSRVHAVTALSADERTELEAYRAEDLRQREWTAGLREADIRCLDCNLRYGERQEYSCVIEGTAHSYDGDELAEARKLQDPEIPRAADASKKCKGCGGEPSFITSGGAVIHNDCPGTLR